MNIEERNEKGKIYNNFRGSLHMGMGAVYIALGVAVMYYRVFGTIELPLAVSVTLGVAMLLYGAFRIWRGYMDLRQNRRG